MEPYAVQIPHPSVCKANVSKLVVTWSSILIRSSTNAACVEGTVRAAGWYLARSIKSCKNISLLFLMKKLVHFGHSNLNLCFVLFLAMDIGTLWRFQVEPLTLTSNSRAMEVYHTMDITWLYEEKMTIISWMATSRSPQWSSIFQCLGLCWSTVARPPHWRDFRASASYRNQSQFSCSPPLGNPSHRRSNTPSSFLKPCLSANLKTKRWLANRSIPLGCHSGSRASGLNAPKRVVQDGPGEMWNVKTMLASIRTTAIKISDLLISGPAQTCHVPCGK